MGIDLEMKRVCGIYDVQYKRRENSGFSKFNDYYFVGKRKI